MNQAYARVKHFPIYIEMISFSSSISRYVAFISEFAKLHWTGKKTVYESCCLIYAVHHEVHPLNVVLLAVA